MKLIQRIGYYLGGFSMGLVILAFFLNGKKTSCSYGPEARVLKNINSKKVIYSDKVTSYLNSNSIDSAEIKTVLKKGDINFTNSKTRVKPCGIYNVEGTVNKKDIILIIENCDSIATITNLKIKLSND
ncbi:MAG: DUF4258 domain-containing protein [Flaviramulus sp.]|nr:hypothetical protein [Flaviramulus sp.]NNC50677.1 DUF4258 domain-containing protein [Flaviramulus sp.]